MAVSKPWPLDGDARLDPAMDRRLERLGLANKPGYCRFIRDLIARRWVMTRRAREQADPKRIHYLSMEFDRRSPPARFSMPMRGRILPEAH